jgi:membrane protease subunit (stomatin/prohibitin family)
MDNSKIVESFTGGRYSLSTSNYPFLDKFRASFSGGENSYKYTVFFISKRPMTNLMWGTREPMEVAMQISLPIPGAIPNIIPIKLQIGINYTVTITDPKTFLLKDTEGTTAVTRTQDELNKLIIRPKIGQFVKSNIARAIQSVDGGIWSVQTQTENISANLENVLNDSFAEYGLRLDHLYIDTLNVLDTEEWVNFKKERADFGTYQLKKAKEALGEVQQLNALGDNWQRIQARDIIKTMAENPGPGGIAATGAGLGMGMVAGGVMGSMAASMFSPMQGAGQTQQQQPAAAPGQMNTPTPDAAGAPSQIKCPHCGENVSGGKFCGNCGQPLPQKSVCPGCGAEIPSGSKFCPNCGTKVL